MLCRNCQREIAEYSNFCYYCGARQQASSLSPTAGKRLRRSSANCKIAGVCGGIGEYLEVDPTIVRLVWVVLSIVPGGFVGGIVAYLLAWIIMPKAPLLAAAAQAPTPGAAQASAHPS